MEEVEGLNTRGVVVCDLLPGPIIERRRQIKGTDI